MMTVMYVQRQLAFALISAEMIAPITGPISMTVVKMIIGLYGMTIRASLGG